MDMCPYLRQRTTYLIVDVEKRQALLIEDVRHPGLCVAPEIKLDII